MRVTTRALCLVLSLGMAAGMMPVSALEAATPETAAYEVSEKQQEQTQPTRAPAPASPETAEQPEAALSVQSVMPMSDPAEGDLIVIDGVTYEIDALPSGATKGQLTLKDGKNYAGELVVTDDMEYAGGKYKVVELGYAAFMGNTALTGVDLSATSVKTVGQNCFRNCTALTHVEFSDTSITNLLQTGVFAGCTSLKTLEIPNANISGKAPFSGSSIQTMTIYAFSGSGDASEFSGLPEGFTLNCPGSLYAYQLNKNAFGTTKNAVLKVATAELKATFEELFAGKSVTVQLLGGEEETVASVSDGTGALTGYPSLDDAIRAVNESQAQGPFTITTRSGGELIQWSEDLTPNKEMVIDFAGCSVNLPDTLTLQAPLTITDVNNFDTEDGLCTVDAGEYPFTMIDGGSFGFAEIKGSDLRFEGRTPGGAALGPQVRLTGVGSDACVTYTDVGRSGYYDILPNMSGFSILKLDNSYLEADVNENFQGQMETVERVEMNHGGLMLHTPAQIETLTGSGELRFAGNGALAVTAAASGSFVLPDYAGTDLGDSALSLPAGSTAQVENQNGDPVETAPAVVRVDGLGEYPSMAEAFAAVQAGDADHYTITLLEDVTLEATTNSGAYGVAELPAKALTINGNGHTLTAGDARTRNYVYAAADLTLENVRLAMPKTYLRITGEGATVTVAGSVTGELEKIDASVSTGCTVQLAAPVSDDVIDGITGTSRNKMTVVLQGYGSLSDPAAESDFPTVSNSSGTLVLENSWLVAGLAANWGGIQIRQGGGLSLTGSMPNASVKSWTVEEGTVADLTVKSGKLTVNGEVSGRTQIHFAGTQMAVQGSTPVKAPKSQADSFVLAPDAAEQLGGLILLPGEDGAFVLTSPTTADAVVTVSGGLFQEGVEFASWAEAAAMLERAGDSEERYTVTLDCDLTLPAGTTLPDLALTIDGSGHTLSLAAGDTLKIQNSLTLQDLALAMDGADLEYVRAANGEKTLTMAASVTGTVGRIVDNSQSRWLDIRIESGSLAFDKVVGTTSTIGTNLTDLILTGLGTRETPVALAGKAENLAALELNNSWVTLSGDASGLGTIRCDFTREDQSVRTGGLILTGDTTLRGLSVTDSDDFELWMPADATLTVLNKYSIMNRQVPVYVQGELEDDHVLVKAPGNGSKKTVDYCLANGAEGQQLYWDKDALCYKVSFAPVIAMTGDAVAYKDYYTKVSLEISDLQGVDKVELNGAEVTLGRSLTFVPDATQLAVGSNTLTVTDVTGNTATYTFAYDTPADYSAVEQALKEVPADMSGYTADSAQAVRSAVQAVVYGAGEQDQAEVDAMAKAIRDAVGRLVKAQSGSQTTTATGSSTSSEESSGSVSSKPAQQQTARVPQTGDREPFALWMAMMMLSLAGLTAGGLVAVKRRKK